MPGPCACSGQKTPPPPWVDEPAVFLHGLEATEDGCRWLLDRWIEFRNLLTRKLKWTLTDVFRFVRLQGKHGVEAVYDPALNAFFLAWDVIWPGLGSEIWRASRARASDRDPGLNAAMEWREIADRPRTQSEAWALIRAEVDQRIERLSATLGDHARVATADAADRAAVDLSPGLARHRRYRLALGRELLRIVDTLRKVSDRKCKMSDGKARMSDARCRISDGKCKNAEMHQETLVGQDSDPVVDHAKPEKLGNTSQANPTKPDKPGIVPQVRRTCGGMHPAQRSRRGRPGGLTPKPARGESPKRTPQECAVT